VQASSSGTLIIQRDKLDKDGWLVDTLVTIEISKGSFSDGIGPSGQLDATIGCSLCGNTPDDLSQRFMIGFQLLCGSSDWRTRDGW
jgi:hypothetical protein